jgi:hypothetical protein
VWCADEAIVAPAAGEAEPRSRSARLGCGRLGAVHVAHEYVFLQVGVAADDRVGCRVEHHVAAVGANSELAREESLDVLGRATVDFEVDLGDLAAQKVATEGASLPKTM